MKLHVLRPLWVAIGLVGLILVSRQFLVPDDFGVHGRNFTYGYHRLSNIQEWKDFPVKHRGREFCVECHEENVSKLNASVHAPVECENCHGPAVNHPDDQENLVLDTTRGLCLRCHAWLDYPNSARGDLVSIEDKRHRRRRECIECHNPHDPREEEE
ncbi:MAG: cytochrome C [Gammaproteobacteria bacterium]|nr:cytochrome C [Gammaproteobacteria bacterium]